MSEKLEGVRIDMRNLAGCADDGGDGKWVVFVNQSGMVAQFPVHSSRLLARLRREENRVRKGGGRKYVFNQK